MDKLSNEQLLTTLKTAAELSLDPGLSFYYNKKCKNVN